MAAKEEVAMRCLECKTGYKKSACWFDFYRGEPGKEKKLLPFCSGTCQERWYERNHKPDVTAVRSDRNKQPTDAIED